MKNTGKKRGFTIVELIIVIAVIGILAAILIPTFASIIDKSTISACTSNAKNLNTAVASELAEQTTGTQFSLDQALVAVAKSGMSEKAMRANNNKSGVDIVWISKVNKFAVIKTSGDAVNPTWSVLYPTDVANDIAEGRVTLNFGDLQSTKRVIVADETIMTDYATQIDGATPEAPKTVEVNSAVELASLAAMSSAFDGNGDPTKAELSLSSTFANVTIEINSDLYFGGTIWTPFGECPKKPFVGNINGNGHTIYGLSNTGYAGGYEFTTATTRTVGEAYGLIAYAGTPKQQGGSETISVSISDLTIENASINAETGVCVGAFVGYVMVNNSTSTSNLTLTNCKASGSISGKNDIGGLVGKFYGNNILMQNCENNVNVKAQTGADVYATKSGGLIGYVSVSVGRTVTLKNCVNNGNVTTINVAENVAASRNWSTSYAGGLIGGNGNSKGTLVFESCTNTGTISAQANSSEAAGQLMGSSSSSTGTTYAMRGTNVFTGTIDADKFESHFNSQLNNACYLVTLTTNPDVVLFGYTALMCYTADYYPTFLYSDNATVNGIAIAGASLQTTSYLNVNNHTTVSVALTAE